MAKSLSEGILTPLKELVTCLSGFDEGTEPFNHILKYFTVKLKKSNSMYFSNKRDIDQNISSMSEKFCFHGFFPQAEALKAAYKLYVSELLSKSEMMNRLNVVKLLLELSDSPTKHFLEHPELFVKQREELEDDIDWGAYLNEGIERWTPCDNESSDNESFSSIDDRESGELAAVNLSDPDDLPQIRSTEKLCIMDLQTNREELLATIQHTWFDEDYFFMEPESQWREANIGILWENYLKDHVQGLILLKSPSIISEYKVIREILWQMWCLHTSSTLELSGNSIRPRPDVTLASIRSYAFYSYMEEFLPYMETLDYFRDFERYLGIDLDQTDHTVCHTYQSYFNCLKEIIEPFYKKLSDLEEEIRHQEVTYTLLILAKDLREIFKPIKLLKEIHDEVVLDPRTNSPLKCATTLITRLHESLHFTSDKLEQDLKLSLFLESVYHYIHLVDSWLIKDDLADYTGEFMIERKVTSDHWHTQFLLRNDIDDVCKKNTFLKIFEEKVLKMGKNINFLRLLGKYDIIGNCEESIYDEFINRVLEKLNKFNNNLDDKGDISNAKENKNMFDLNSEICEANFIFPVVGTDICKTNPDVQKLENLVDIEDGFLVTAFADFFVKKTIEEDKRDETLFEKISKITKNLFPKTNFFENILSNIIDRRFTISGLMVKNLLIEDHLLEKQFHFLQHLYLFSDDLIFPFYRRLFEKTESTSSKNWANDIWLTSHLHDIFMDGYPEFYEKCSVQVKENWSLCTDSLSACSWINVNYKMSWPLNIIIKQGHMKLYEEIFQFLLKLKWALHTVNHLVFSDLDPKNKAFRKSQEAFKEINHKNKVTAKLIRLKFCLINILNSLQHFVFGFIFGRNLQKFELDFERAYDLNSLIESHSVFINAVSDTVLALKEKMLDKDKSYKVLTCVNLLKRMWNDPKYATLDRLSDCNEMYTSFYSDISSIIFPVYIYDY